MVEQLRSVSKTRIGEKLSKLKDEEMKVVEMLGLAGNFFVGNQR